MDKGKISVIIPVYNSEKYLSQCLKSVVNQSYKNLEIIVVNDGSTDKSLSIIEKFAQKDNRIKVYNQKNQGGSVALDNGIKYSTGDYIAFLDSDDYLVDGAYELLIKKINTEQDVDLCLFVYNAINNNNELLYQSNIDSIKEEKITTLKDDARILIYYYSAQWMIFARSSLIKDNNLKFDNTYFGYDMLFHLNVIKFAKKIYILKDYLINYHVGNLESSAGALTRSKLYSIHFDCFNHCIEAYKNEEKFIKDINVCRQYDILFLYLNESVPEFYVKNYFMLREFSLSFDKNVVDSLKTSKPVYDRYKSIVDGFDYLTCAIEKIIKNQRLAMGNEIKRITDSKSYRIGRLITSPYRFIRKIFKK